VGGRATLETHVKWRNAMGLAEMLLNAHGGGATDLLAQRFGISPEQAASALSALAPALASGIQQNAASEGGLQHSWDSRP
jgi:hypothetical protein